MLPFMCWNFCASMIGILPLCPSAMVATNTPYWMLWSALTLLLKFWMWVHLATALTALFILHTGISIPASKWYCTPGECDHTINSARKELTILLLGCLLWKHPNQSPWENTRKVSVDFTLWATHKNRSNSRVSVYFSSEILADRFWTLHLLSCRLASFKAICKALSYSPTASSAWNGWQYNVWPICSRCLPDCTTILRLV